jgi:cytochrome P450
VATTVGGVSIPAGATLMVLNGAASRDPSRFEAPDELRPERPNARDHLAFGLGLHSCPGAPLARAEGKVSLHRILDRMADIRVSEKEHGSEGARRYDYAPTFILRGLMRLHLEYTPVG